MWETALGGLLAITGGLIATYLQMRHIRKNKMEEVIAERKVTTNAQAYSYIKEIDGLLIQGDSKLTYDLILSHEKWFFENRLFLPGKYPEKWLSIRNQLRKLIILENENKDISEISKYQNSITKNIGEAIDEIYSDMDLEKLYCQEKLRLI